jgi:hypothetical protein
MNNELDIKENKSGNFTTGFTWGILLSIPLWLSFIGWIKIIYKFLNT